MILVLSNQQDEHAAAVIRELQIMGQESVLFDLSLFPSRSSISIACGDSKPPCRLIYLGNVAIDLSTCQSVWWRRPSEPRIDPCVAPEEVYFTRRECDEALSGLWEALDVHWVNAPGKNEAAAKKVYQLRLAAEVGLLVPKTLITNSPADALSFIESQRPVRVIFKAFAGSRRHWRETRLITEREVRLLNRVRLAPVIFQEYIEGGCDVRVTCVGTRVFSAMIDLRRTEYEFDFRMSFERASVHAISLPVEVERGVRLMMSRLGLIYGAMDFRVSPDGRFFFLELNPGGQWLFVERRTGQLIAQEIAQVLSDA